MRVLILYGSVFGNTEKIARAIAEGFASEDLVEVMRIEDAKINSLENRDMFFVGSPTRAFQPMPTVKSFLNAIPAGKLSGVRVAAFDTRIPVNDKTPGFLRLMIKFFGYAAKPMSNILLKKGGTQAAPPEGFFVEGTEGPIQSGELERATAWAKGCR